MPEYGKKVSREPGTIGAAQLIRRQPGKDNTADAGIAGPRTAAQRRLVEDVGNSPRVLQQRARLEQLGVANTPEPAVAPRPNRTGLPDTLKSGIEDLSGMSMDHVRVHYNSAQPASMNAHAYAQGNDIHLAAGQERHLPHEAWHVVQQAQGRVRQAAQLMNGSPVNTDPVLEREADVMGSRALTAQGTDAAAVSGASMSPHAPNGVVQGYFEMGPEKRRVVVQRTGLDDVAVPKVWQMTDEQNKYQSEIMLNLNKLIEDNSAEMNTSPHNVYRICAFRLEKREDGKIQFNAEKPGVVPSGISDGFDLLKNEDIKNRIGWNVLNTMQGSGQLSYVNERILGNPLWDVVVDVDFYYERPANQVGFHKDTIGRSLFVNLNFNNSADIMGPEYVLNPPPIGEHDQHIEPKLPREFIEDLIAQRQKLPQPTGIEATRVPPSGVVSFVDELVHHTTPYQQHRALSSEEFEKQILQSAFADPYRMVRRAIRFTALVNNTLEAKMTPREQLLGLELEDQQVDYLLEGADSVSTGRIRTLLHRNEEYEEMKRLPAKDPHMRTLYRLMKDNFTITREMMESRQLPNYIINALIPDLRNVSLAGCDEDCDRDAHYQAFPIMPGPFAPRLRRAMSGILQRGELPLPVLEKRQFFRTWVQAVPKKHSPESHMQGKTL